MTSWDDVEAADVGSVPVDVKFVAPSGQGAKESWEDDEPKPATATAATTAAVAPAATTAPSSKASKARKKAMKEKEEQEQAKLAKQQQQEAAAAVDPLKEKQRRQKIVEESDLKNAQEMFGDLSSAGELDGFVPKSAEDFIQFAKMLGQRASHFSEDHHYPEFCKELVRQIVAPMKSNDIHDLIVALTVVMNTKMKVEKGPQSTASKKKQIAQQQKAKAIAAKAGDDEPDEIQDEEYVQLEDKYDFM